MFVFFLLLTLVVQIGFLVVARNAASVAVEGAVRDAARRPESIGVVEQRLVRDVGATVPGAANTVVEVSTNGLSVTGEVSFDWKPPGPDLAPITVTISRTVPMGIPP